MDTASISDERTLGGANESGLRESVQGNNESYQAQPLTSSSSTRRDEDEEEDVCRICRNTGDEDNPLRYPCACSGSIKFVHQDCLLQWLNHSNARQCEVCKHSFAFSPVYAENAPSRLSFQEFVVGIALKVFHVLRFFLRLSFVLYIWLLIIPFITFWMCRLSIVRSFSEAKTLFISHISPTAVITDCLHGFVLSAGIVFIFLGVTSMRDYFRHLRELRGQNVEREDERDENGGNIAGEPLENANINDAGDEQVPRAGQLIRRNAENVAAMLELQAARLEAHVEQIFDGLDDADGAEDVPFDELVGMQGPLSHLVENAFTVLASNMIFMGAIIFVPFSLGRFMLYYLSWVSSLKIPMISTVLPHEDTAVTFTNITLSSDSNSTSESNDVFLDQAVELLKSNTTTAYNTSSLLSLDPLKNSTISSFLFSDLATLAVGYSFVFMWVSSYFILAALIRYAKGEPFVVGRFNSLVSVAQTAPSIARQGYAVMRHLLIMIKVAFLLVIELGVFPLMCGWWLDVCTVRMFGKSMARRLLFFSASPLASSLIHWVIGIMYMLQISIFVSLLRGVLRNGVLYFLRDPADPNYNPFRDLIDDPVYKHARRVLLSVAVYGSLIVLLVFLPVKLAMRVAPSIFPLDISVSDPFTEIPADMLLFQICIPFAVKHFKLRATVKLCLHFWFSTVGTALGLQHFLLPAPEDDEGNLDDENPGHVLQNEAREDEDEAADVSTHSDEEEDDDTITDVAENSNGLDEYDDDAQSDSERYSFALRIVLLLVAAWMTLLVLNSALIIVPITLGRILFHSIPHLPVTHGIKCNDLYAFIIGSYTIWTTIAGLRYSYEQIMTDRAALLFAQIQKWCGIVLKSSALLALWIFVIPVLIGLLFELLVTVPMWVPLDETPVFLLYQDWALGLIFLKIWTRLAMLDHVIPLMDDSWRTKFERVRENGFSRLQSLWVLQEIVLPIIMKLLTALCVPYVLSKAVFPMLGYPLTVNSAAYRYSWLVCLCFGLCCFCVKRFHIWFTNLHNSIRDDRYLIGRRLHNYGEGRKEEEVGSISSDEGQNRNLLGSS